MVITPSSKGEWFQFLIGIINRGEYEVLNAIFEVSIPYRYYKSKVYGINKDEDG